jgi:hypothetical protein
MDGVALIELFNDIVVVAVGAVEGRSLSKVSVRNSRSRNGPVTHLATNDLNNHTKNFTHARRTCRGSVNLATEGTASIYSTGLITLSIEYVLRNQTDSSL